MKDIEQAKPCILVSRCLLGECCRYDGASRPHVGVQRLCDHYTLIPVCPECDGGLPVPRPPAERQGERVVNCHGVDVTAQYEAGARHAVSLAKEYGAICAILKLRSPACGRGRIYDGTFTGTLVDGDGVAAEALLQQGIPVYGEDVVSTDGVLLLEPFLREGGSQLV